MKKVVLALGFFTFILFGAVTVDNVSAATTGVEIVELDKDPAKDGDKKKAEVKEEKACASASKASDKGCCAKASKCGDKASTAMASKGDCAKDCSKECPDKK